MAEALEEETGLRVTEVELRDQGAQAELTVRLDWQGEPLAVTVGLT